MRSPQKYPLPQAGQQYHHTNENLLRNSIEDAYSVLRDDVVTVENQTSKESSLAQRRFQFLLMGA